LEAHNNLIETPSQKAVFNIIFSLAAVKATKVKVSAKDFSMISQETLKSLKHI